VILLELSLFGGFQARLKPGGAIVLPTRKSRALLAYLALHPDQARSRESLACLLWSDRAERQAHNSLSQAVSALRKVLGDETPPPLRIEAESIAFITSAAEVDALAFERLVSAGRPEDLDRAEALYQGDLLAGIGVRDPVFEDWLGFEQERLRALAMSALTKLLGYRERQGQRERLAGTARRLLQLDPLQEAAHRALMRCYVNQAQPGLALRQYEICADTLKRELGVEPEEETTRVRSGIIGRRSVVLTASADVGNQTTGASDAREGDDGQEPKGPGSIAVASKATRPSLARWPVAAAVAVTLLALAAAVSWLRPWEAQVEPASVHRMAFPLPDKPSIVVLPFTNMSDDPSQDYFADGLAEDLITDLARISGIFVISRNSAFTYRGRSVKTGEVAEDLGVRYVLEGSVRRVGDRVRINAQLIDATTGGHLWAERYDGPLTDVFALQDKVAERIVDALALELMPQEVRRVGRGGTENVAAHDAYLLGLSSYHRRTPEDNAQAAVRFRQAIQLDPDYSEAYTALAKVYVQAAIGEMAYSEKLPIHWRAAYARAWELLEKGMARPNADFHVLRSWLALKKHQHDRAIAEAERALELRPNDAEALEALAEALIYAGRPEQGIEFAQRAMRQNPAFLGRPLYLLGLAEFALGHPDKAVEHLDRAIRHAPKETDILAVLAAAYAELGLIEQAKAAFATFREQWGGRMGWGGWHTLAKPVTAYPFSNPGVLGRLADGLRGAGATASVGGHLPLHTTNKLTGPEIKSLLFGKEIKGIEFWREGAWRQRRSADGGVAHVGTPIHPGVGGGDTGDGRIEDDMLCERWPVLSTAFEMCVVVFRISERNARIRWGDYVMVTDTGPHPFRVVE
jgi:TolB-like protein/DNA-binding SARP family transcriptional activator